MKPTLNSAALKLAIGTALAFPSVAAELLVNVEVPQINVAEYHRPYVAVWIEGANREVLANLSVWYQQRAGEEGHGSKWLPDLRQWWRRSGRSLEVPIDGVTGPTRPAGEHLLSFSDQDLPQLAGLAAGQYTLMVEASREVGGRELLKIPFHWQPDSETDSQVTRAQGERELGAVVVRVES